MLNDELIDILGLELVDVYQRLEDAVISDIARRLEKSDRWTETAELQAKSMREMGWSPARIRAEVIRRIHADPEYIAFVNENTLQAKALQQEEINKAKEQLRALAPEIYETVGNMSWNNDLSMWEKAGKTLDRSAAIDQIIQNYRKDGVDGILNLTGSMGFSYPTGTVSMRRAYTKALDDALVKTTSGAFSYTSALEASVRELARSGLRHIDFSAGVTRGIDTAVRNALLTSFGQLAGAIMQENIEASNVGYVQVSAHWGARPSHAVWQGKVYTMQEFKNVCGYGEPGNADHIYSYNCRHQHYPYWPGVSEPIKYEPEPGPFEVDGKTYTYYQATQKQRAMERRIRELKREVNAGGDKAVLGSLIRNKTQEYHAFSKAVNIRPKVERLRVASYDKGTESSAIMTVRILENSMPDGKRILSGYVRAVNSGDIHALTGADVYFSVAKEIQDRLVGVTAVNGVKVESFSTHFIDRVIGQAAESHPNKRKGVPVDDVLDALINGKAGTVRVNLDSKEGQKIIGEKCEVTINPITGNLIQVNPKVVQSDVKNQR